MSCEVQGAGDTVKHKIKLSAFMELISRWGNKL